MAPEISSAGALTSTTSGASFKYTTDGSDPRYSLSAKEGQPSNVDTGDTINAYAFKDGMFPSAGVSKTI